MARSPSAGAGAETKRPRRAWASGLHGLGQQGGDLVGAGVHYRGDQLGDGGGRGGGGDGVPKVGRDLGDDGGKYIQD